MFVSVSRQGRLNSSLLLCFCPPSLSCAPEGVRHLDEMELQMVGGMTGFQELL